MKPILYYIETHDFKWTHIGLDPYMISTSQIVIARWCIIRSIHSILKIDEFDLLTNSVNLGLLQLFDKLFYLSLICICYCREMRAYLPFVIFEELYELKKLDLIIYTL